jgi:hypothetical protein
MNWDDLNADADGLLHAQADIEQEFQTLKADPRNGAKREACLRHLQKHRQRLEQFIDVLDRLRQ